MGWMSRFAGKDEKKQNIVTEAQLRKHQGAASIQHHPGLIDQYLSTHRELESLFGNMGDAVKQGKYDRLQAAIVDFKSTFESHLLSENVRFYGYMAQLMKADQHNTELVKSFRTEMAGIARHVSKFLRKWKEGGVTAETSEEFMEEYTRIGEVLARRIHSEEKDLYPLYRPLH